MSPITHFLAGWAVANAARLEKRDRLLVAIAAVVPDLDGMDVFIDILAQNKNNPFEFYQQYHHVFGHNLLFGISAIQA